MKRILLVLMAALFAAPMAAVTLAPPAHAQASGYLIQPGDVLQVTVLEDETLNQQSLVLPDGRISVPLAGSVQAAGRTVQSIESTIASQLSSNFAVRPNVFVSVVSVEEPLDVLFDIFVLGQVANPGPKEIEVGTTLLQGIALGGGLDRFAARKRIQLRRTDASGQEKLYLFNYDAVERGGAILTMITLREGDVIIVPERRLFE